MEDRQILRQRMYHLVLYSLSGIQKGIQAYHSGIEYALMGWEQPEFQRWAKTDKTVIILSGGTSNNVGYDVWGNKYEGSMEQHVKTLSNAGIKHTTFFEPDINNACTSLAFLVSEMVWDTAKYPDPKGPELCEPGMSVLSMLTIDDLIFKFYEDKYGYEVAFLRTWLRQFKLA